MHAKIQKQRKTTNIPESNKRIVFPFHFNLYFSIYALWLFLLLPYLKGILGPVEKINFFRRCNHSI